MGRRFPASENPSIHPAISFSLLVASIAATICIVTALCGARFRKKSSSSSPDKTTEKSQIVTPPTTTMAVTTTPPLMPSPPSPSTSTADLEDKTEKKNEIPEFQVPLKPPPMRQLRESSSYSCHNSNSTQEGLKTSMSLRVPRSFSVAKNRSRKEERQYKKKEKLKTEDSVWMKTIILGEKCRVPDEDDAVLYDDKGNRISTFHPKTPRSLPPSRTNSFNNPQAIPSRKYVLKLCWIIFLLVSRVVDCSIACFDF